MYFSKVKLGKLKFHAPPSTAHTLKYTQNYKTDRKFKIFFLQKSDQVFVVLLVMLDMFANFQQLQI